MNWKFTRSHPPRNAALTHARIRPSEVSVTGRQPPRMDPDPHADWAHAPSGITGFHGRGLLTLSISSRGVAPRKAPHAHRIERPLTAGGVCYPPLGIPGVMLAACPARVGVRVVLGHPHAPTGAWVLPSPSRGERRPVGCLRAARVAVSSYMRSWL